MENECEALPGVAYPGVRDNRSTINTKTGYDDDDGRYTFFMTYCRSPGGDAVAALSDTACYTIYIQSSHGDGLGGVCALGVFLFVNAENVPCRCVCGQLA